MSSDVPATTHVVGVSAIVVTLRDHGTLREDELLVVCGNYGLRAGAVPWRAALARAEKLRLVERTQSLTLSEFGRCMCGLIEDGQLEPSEPFFQAMAVLALGQGQQRSLLAQARLDGAGVNDPKGMAKDILDAFVGLGMLTGQADGRWGLCGTEFEPLMLGLMFARASGNKATDEVGKLGEQLTLRWFREQGWHALHVAEVSSHFGFDVFLRRHPPTGEPNRSVEAKATTGTTELVIHLSPHEMRVAARVRDRYDVVVWGSINRAESLDANYRRLVLLGYPRIITDPMTKIARDQPALIAGLQTEVGVVLPEGIMLKVAPPTPFAAPSAPSSPASPRSPASRS